MNDCVAGYGLSVNIKLVSVCVFCYAGRESLSASLTNMYSLDIHRPRVVRQTDSHYESMNKLMSELNEQTVNYIRVVPQVLSLALRLFEQHGTSAC